MKISYDEILNTLKAEEAEIKDKEDQQDGNQQIAIGDEDE